MCESIDVYNMREYPILTGCMDATKYGTIWRVSMQKVTMESSNSVK